MVVPGFVLSTIRATTVPSSSMRTATTSKLSATGRKGKPRDLYDSARGHALCYPPEKGTSLNSHSTFAIETSDLVKSFGDTRAVDGVDLAVPTGSVYGVLGPNGAGKTTTIRMLATLIRPDAGSARVLGHDIVASIVVTPRVMFLDEPTTGLDPRSRGQVWEIIRALVAEGTTILLCTQYLEEADQLADGIAVIDHGRVIAEGTPAQLK